MLPAEGAVQLQVTLGGPDEDGQRAVEVHARPEDAEAAVDPARQRAAGPGAAPDRAGRPEFAAWPPAGAVPVTWRACTSGWPRRGYGYGPAFRGLRAAWRRGDEVFAEVALPEEAAARPAGFGLHPALLDAALHAAALAR